MLKYCSGCERDLEIDNFYSFEKSTCKECVNKKVKCEYCDKEFNSTNLSKHIKQIHSTYSSSGTNDSTYNSSGTTDSTSKKANKNNRTSYNTDKNNSTSYKADKTNSTSEITLAYHLYINSYADSLKNNNSYDKKVIEKINKILASSRILNDKIAKDSINQNKQRQFVDNLEKLKDLKYFDEKICNITLNGIQ